MKAATKASLSSIRTFVVVARTGSFTRAAQRLHVTQGAVSQQIAKLEDYLGVKLFDRKARALSLTAPGQRLFRGVAESIERVDAETDAARVNVHSEIVSITAFSSFAAQWLIPRLSGFEHAHPEVAIRCETTSLLLDLAQAGIDLGFRFGPGEWPQLRADKLLHHRIYPVATPEYCETLALGDGPRALGAAPLYYDLETPTEWSRWFDKAGAGDVEPNLLRGFSDTLVMLSALLSGVPGVALIGDHLIQRELAQGRLRKVFDVYLAPEGAYYLVSPAAQPLSGAAHKFRAWVLAVAAAEALVE